MQPFEFDPLVCADQLGSDFISQNAAKGPTSQPICASSLAPRTIRAMRAVIPSIVRMGAGCGQWAGKSVNRNIRGDMTSEDTSIA